MIRPTFDEDELDGYSPHDPRPCHGGPRRPLVMDDAEAERLYRLLGNAVGLALSCHHYMTVGDLLALRGELEA